MLQDRMEGLCMGGGDTHIQRLPPSTTQATGTHHKVQQQGAWPHALQIAMLLPRACVIFMFLIVLKMLVFFFCP